MHEEQLYTKFSFNKFREQALLEGCSELVNLALKKYDNVGLLVQRSSNRIAAHHFQFTGQNDSTDRKAVLRMNIVQKGNYD